MAKRVAAVQTYNDELFKVLGDLQSRRDELNSQINREEEEKEQMQQDLQILSDKLSKVEENLIQILAARAVVENTITETEAEYSNILESSHSLLDVLKEEAENLTKAAEPVPKED